MNGVKEGLLISILIFKAYFLSNALAPTDTVYVKNFNTGDFKAASINYTGFVGIDGFYYFANENGVLKYDGSRWQLIAIKNFRGVYSMAQNSDGIIFVGGLGELGYLELKNGHYLYHSLNEKIKTDLEINEIWQIVISGEDVYYCSYESIFRYDGEELHQINLKNSQIFLVDGKVLVSVLEGGLFEIRSDSAYNVHESLGLARDAAFAFLPTKTPYKHWMMTSENGVYEFDSRTFQLDKLTLPSSEVLEKQGVYDAILWRDSIYAVSTWYGGLYFIDQQGVVQKTISREEGLQSTSLREFFQDYRGNLWLGSAYGISYLSWRDNYRIKDFTPRTIITDSVFSYTRDSLINSVEFRFATTNYDISELEYSYYLEGFDADYSAWLQETRKEYTNLDGGEYTFHVRAKLPDGSITEPALAPLLIPTPWYKNKWALGVFGLVALGLIFGGIRFRTSKLKGLNKRLEKIINNRTKELIEQREQLKSANSELKVTNSELDNFVYRSSHDLVAPLKSLRGLIQLAKIESTDQNLGQYFKRMNTSVLKLEEFIKSIMEYSTNTKSIIAYEEIHLNEIIDSILEDLRFFDNADSVKIIKSFAEDTYIKTDIKRLNIILSNLITNSIKYHNYDQATPFIEIKAISDNKSIKIKVCDNGMGIDHEHLENIFDMFYRATESSEGSGLGLYIVKDTVDMLEGKIHAESTVEKGTTFTITLPQH